LSWDGTTEQAQAIADLARWTLDIMNHHKRVAIVGAPCAGKTTLAKSVDDRPIIHSDDFMGLPWSEASAAVATHCNELGGSFVVEGVRVPHALRKGLQVDAVIYLTTQHKQWNEGQHRMAKAVATVFREWLDRTENAKIPVFIW
jgi:dephospho-CoA kinase